MINTSSIILTIKDLQALETRELSRGGLRAASIPEPLPRALDFETFKHQPILWGHFRDPLLAETLGMGRANLFTLQNYEVKEKVTDLFNTIQTAQSPLLKEDEYRNIGMLIKHLIKEDFERGSSFVEEFIVNNNGIDNKWRLYATEGILKDFRGYNLRKVFSREDSENYQRFIGLIEKGLLFATKHVKEVNSDPNHLNSFFEDPESQLAIRANKDLKKISSDYKCTIDSQAVFLLQYSSHLLKALETGSYEAQNKAFDILHVGEKVFNSPTVVTCEGHLNGLALLVFVLDKKKDDPQSYFETIAHELEHNYIDDTIKRKENKISPNSIDEIKCDLNAFLFSLLHNRYSTDEGIVKARAEELTYREKNSKVHNEQNSTSNEEHEAGRAILFDIIEGCKDKIPYIELFANLNIAIEKTLLACQHKTFPDLKTFIGEVLKKTNPDLRQYGIELKFKDGLEVTLEEGYAHVPRVEVIQI